MFKEFEDSLDQIEMETRLANSKDPDVRKLWEMYLTYYNRCTTLDYRVRELRQKLAKERKKKKRWKNKCMRNMRGYYKFFQRTRDNKEVVEDIRQEIGKEDRDYTDLQVLNCLLTDISISLAGIFDLMNLEASKRDFGENDEQP